jgi:hypothetical protein
MPDNRNLLRNRFATKQTRDDDSLAILMACGMADTIVNNTSIEIHEPVRRAPRFNPAKPVYEFDLKFLSGARCTVQIRNARESV